MNTQTIQRQYDEVISSLYDLDPQSVLGSSLDRAADQLHRNCLLGNGGSPLRVLDVGVGTGGFLARLKQLAGEQVQPYGLDLSEKMVAIAREKIPDLIAEVDDAANLDHHFPGQSFDLICTHFVTGFVPMHVLAPMILSRLNEGGYWSLVAGTTAGFPVLRAKANGKLVRLLYGGRSIEVDEIVCNPSGRAEVVKTLQANGFSVRECETFEPTVMFKNFRQFMEFAYTGGWLTPFVEAAGLHQASRATRLMLDLVFFPVEDHHSIEIVLARKMPAEQRGG